MRAQTKLLARVGAVLLAVALLVSLIWWIPLERRGREYRFEVIVGVGKYPEDDPWESGAGTLFGFPPSDWHSYSLSTTAGSLTSSSVMNVVNISTFFSPLDLTTYYYISSYTVRSEFVFTSTVSASVRITWPSSTPPVLVAFIPTRTFTGGLIYRWSITIPAYVSNNLVIPVHTRPKGTNGMGSMSGVYTTRCFYLDPQTGTTLSSTSGLTTSISFNRVNATHATMTYRITFGGEWNARIVQGCIIFTTNSGVINDINSVPARNMNIQSPILLLYHMYSTTVYTGDMFTYVVWYVAPASL